MDKLLRASDIFNDYHDLIKYFNQRNSDQRNIFTSSYLDEPWWDLQRESVDEKKDLTVNEWKFTLESSADKKWKC